MDAERVALYWRAKPVAMQALDIPGEKREAWFDEACGDDTVLRREAEWIAWAAENTDGAGLTPGEALRAGDHLHAADNNTYRILRRLGEGGMGVVYLAVRRSGGTRQQVALKLLHAASMKDGMHAWRFARECRILARLEHPNIAHLVDNGHTRDGRPFLAMEHVDGERIDTWCRRHAVSLRARVKLFVKVCVAVQYAHQHGIIHRDIKPANILVTEAGIPKLLDFGIARQQGNDVDDAQRTAPALRTLTLAYASPEQILGEPLSPAVDVWSLGVVLYQLLCGVRPFGGDGGGVSPLEVSNAIVAGRPLPPNRHAGRHGKIPAGLEAVVLKALRRNPRRRYPDITELIADLQRWLDFQPVHARQGARWYLAQLFAYRHRAELAVVVLVLALLVAFVVASEVRLHYPEVERDRALVIAVLVEDVPGCVGDVIFLSTRPPAPPGADGRWRLPASPFRD